MKSFGSKKIARRYVAPLFEVAVAAKAVDAVDKDLKQIADALSHDGVFLDFVENPLYTRPQKAKAVSALADQLQLNAITKSFLVTLANQQRLSLIIAASEIFSEKAKEMRGEMDAEIVSAKPLSQAEQKEIENHLHKTYGKKITLTSRVDEALIGGVIITIGSTQFDASLAGKLNRLNIALKAA